LREVEYLRREIIAALSPRIGVMESILGWQKIAKALAETPRKRRRQILS